MDNRSIIRSWLFIILMFPHRHKREVKQGLCDLPPSGVWMFWCPWSSYTYSSMRTFHVWPSVVDTGLLKCKFDLFPTFISLKELWPRGFWFCQNIMNGFTHLILFGRNLTSFWLLCALLSPKFLEKHRACIGCSLLLY